MTDSIWYEIAVEVAGIDGEVAADLMRQKCEGGAAIESSHRLDVATDTYVVDGDGTAIVRGYVPEGTDATAVKRRLQLALQMAPLQSPPKWRRVRRLREEAWRDAWKKGFGIQRVGLALVVKPSWVTYKVRTGETVVEIDPGMAFGTGQHPTTAMCLRGLEESVRAGSRVLDLGCGSGILAIAAAKLGAMRVLALDTDAQAVKATRANAAANGVADLMEVREGTLAETPHRGVSTPEVYDVIVANISGLALTRLAGLLAATLAPGGVLIASGFLEDAVEGVGAALAETGLTRRQVIAEGVWRAIVARRPSG